MKSVGSESTLSYTHAHPHSCLMALKRMGIVDKYEHIWECTVAVVGVGG